MDWEEIKRARETRKLLEDLGVGEALKQKQLLQDAVGNVNRLSEQAALVNATLSHPTYTVNVKPLLDAIEALRRPLPPEWVQAKTNFEDFLLKFARSIVEIRNSINANAEPLRDFLQKYQDANRRLNEAVTNAPPNSLLGFLAQQATGVYKANAEIMLRGIEQKDLLRSDPALASRLMLPAVSYVDFSQRTVERIGKSEDPGERAALGGSLLVAEEHVTDSTRLIVEATDETHSLSGLTVDRKLSEVYAIYDAVQLDLIDVQNLPHEATYPVLLRFSSAASLAELTRRTLNAVLRCNKTCRLGSRQEIFKPTSQAQEGLVMLSGIVVRDESSLRDLVSYLYMLIYEGAGDKHPRFLKENGGPMERTDCDAVWNLKALRNKWLIHDPEHGGEKAIDSSYRTLADALKSFGLIAYPGNSREFEDLQRRLLAGLEDFLKELERRIVAP